MMRSARTVPEGSQTSAAALNSHMGSFSMRFGQAVTLLLTALNLRLGFVNEKWDVSFFIKNLTDEIAFLALDQERGTLARVGYLTNQPRTFGVTSRIKF